MNIKGATFLQEDIRNVKADVLAQQFASSRSKSLFSCCAPCQPFSKQSRAKSQGDPRRSLLPEFGRFVQRWKPDYVFVENVPGLQRVEGHNGPLPEFIALLNAMSYSFDLKIVPALAFGVPQKRERLILMAAKSGAVQIPPPTHGTRRRKVTTVMIGSEGSLRFVQAQRIPRIRITGRWPCLRSTFSALRQPRKAAAETTGRNRFGSIAISNATVIRRVRRLAWTPRGRSDDQVHQLFKWKIWPPHARSGHQRPRSRLPPDVPPRVHVRRHSRIQGPTDR